jgi:NAD(P)-dependent dehydrogenase (short-subunit alcohol dehydrogenase family)
MAKQPLITTGNLPANALSDRVAIVTGGGTGIGFEAARSLAWLGVNVVIAEIDKQAGSNAASQISAEMNNDNVTFIHTDVGDQSSVERLATAIRKKLGRVDIVLNNAAVEPVGPVVEASIESWDHSYRVNLRGPVLMARAFLPEMVKRNSGVFVCVSSVGGAFMGPYEVLKRAQVELAATIASECEHSDVVAFAIGPGLVPETRGAAEGIPKIASMMGKTVAEFEEMSKSVLISVEAAGAGFAAAIALASQFRGLETSSQEALRAAGIQWATESDHGNRATLSKDQAAKASDLTHLLLLALQEQLRQWQGMGMFQRGWMFRDFTKRAGLPVEKYIERMIVLEAQLSTGG